MGDALGRGPAASPDANGPIPTGRLTPPLRASRPVLVGSLQTKNPLKASGMGVKGWPCPCADGRGLGRARLNRRLYPFLSFLFCLCPVWSSLAVSKSRRLRYLRTHRSGSRRSWQRPCVPPCVAWGSVGTSARGSCPRTCSLCARSRAFSLPGGLQASGSPLVTFSPSQISGLGSQRS